MKKMRLLAILLSVAIGLVGCGGTGNVDTGKTSKESQKTDSETADSSDDFGSFTPVDKTATIEETTLYEDESVKIIAKELTFDSNAMALNLELVNSTDRQLEFCAEVVGYSYNAVNRRMIEDGYVGCEVGPGETVEDAIEFDYDELMVQGISTVAEIGTGFSIHDDGYDIKIQTGAIKVETDKAQDFDFETTSDSYNDAINSKAYQYTYGYEMNKFSKDTVYDSNGISIVSEAFMTNGDGERVVFYELKNASENDISVKINDVKANNTTIYDGLWSADTIAAGASMVLAIELDDILEKEEWEEKGIDEVESISFTPDIRTSDDIVIAEPTEVVINLK